MKCDQCYYRVPNMNGDYCCARYIHPKLKKSNHTGPPVGGAWQMCQGKHFQQRAPVAQSPKESP